MDSGNSGSMSSSEGDDHDLDVASRPQSVSWFLNPSPSNNNNNNNPNLFFQYQQNHPNSNPFDLSTNYLHNALPQPQPPTSSNQTFIFNNQSSNLDPNPTTNARSNHQQQQLLPSSSSAHISKPSISVRNSKKRTRASRRAPTTVLTTDTSNFRAMVQEFTGIPAPPFSSASASPYSRRLDNIFWSAGSVYPLRPSAQKVHQYAPFLSSSNSSPSLLMSSSVGMVRASSSSSNNTSHHDVNNFSFTTQQGLIGNQISHNHNIMGNMQNPSFNASHSSILHHHDQLPSFLSSSFGAKPNRDSGRSATLPLISLEDQLGMSMSGHGYQSTSLDGSTMLPLRSDGDHDLRWRDHHELGLGSVSEGRGVTDQNDQLKPSLGDQELVNSSRSNTPRSIEAPVDSWVFSSD